MKKSTRRVTNPLLSIKAIIYITFTAIILITIYFLSTDIEKYISNSINSKVVNIGASNSSDKLRTIKIANEYDFDISVYFEDGETGSFLANISPNNIIQVSALSGHRLYATDANGWDRLSDINIVPNKDKYSFKSLKQDTNSEFIENSTKEGSSYYTLNVRRESRANPKVKGLNRQEKAIGAMAAKFRSLSSKTVDLWYDDGEDGIYNGHLDEGQETTTNTYEGHVFYVTRAGNKEEVITSFEMDPNQVIYVIRDDKYPASTEVIVETEEELEFIETDHIVSLASPKLHKSAVGDANTGVLESQTRTSLNSWIDRHKSKITNTLFQRAANLLNIDEQLLETHKNVEQLQVVHYSIGQKYDSHHDWGVSGHPESRYITLLLYLNDKESEQAGGDTSFPKAVIDGQQVGIKVHPGKGSAVLFYNLLEDGNGDDLSLHAALPVVKGEKWLANFWVWDPVMRTK
eukprot:gene17509-23068_t